MPYKIEMLYFSGWNDANWIEEIEDEQRPMRFETIAGAQECLAEFFAEIKKAVGLDDMDCEENPHDYRVASVS